ncbi:MAG TPA: CRTAC1 family protein [Candidatus Acidoferrum sp.]|nr:CRTAC1 family protein [Candidatus Acidoferrum sp.]
MPQMGVTRSRTLLFISILFFASFSSTFSPPAAAQSATVPLPPASKLPKSKANRAGFSPVPVFKDIARERGLTVSHISSSEKRYIVESMSGGVGLFDCDGDGRMDIVTVNGSTVDRFLQGGDPMVTLYHQEADGTFRDITREAGLTRRGWGMGVAVADYDNDGKLDLFVTGYGGNVLYRNLGGCKFEDVTEKAGVRGGGFSTGAAWGDYDRDGNVDLFVSRYVHVDLQNLPKFGGDKYCQYKGLLVQCGPWGLPGESDLLYHNRGDGTFEEVSQKAGVHDDIGYYGLGVEWTDYDNDGWPDLFVANDSVPNYLYHNNHNGTFTETGMLAGVALSGDGTQLGNMGVDFGDYDHSGRFCLLDTTFQEQPKALWKNLGANGFEDVSWASGIGRPSYSDVCWGTSFFDMDNDGWLDLLIACGHVYPQMDELPEGPKYRQPIFLERNNRDGTFDEVTREAGLSDLPLQSRRGAAFGDIFNTGNVDAVILNVGEPPSLLLNSNHDGNHRVEFRLEGTKSNRAAIGARVTIQAGAVRQMGEVRGGGSYLSQNDLRLHFGLGKENKMESVQIRWPSGKLEILKDVAADAIYTVVEGAGIRSTQPLPALPKKKELEPRERHIHK